MPIPDPVNVERIAVRAADHTDYPDFRLQSEVATRALSHFVAVERTPGRLSGPGRSALHNILYGLLGRLAGQLCIMYDRLLTCRSNRACPASSPTRPRSSNCRRKARPVPARPSTGASSKLVEFASIASFVRVPGIVAVIIVMYFVDPIQVPEGASPVELQALVVEYQSVVASTRPVLVVQAIDLLVGLCASALHGVALFVVSGCSVTRAVAAATVSGMFHLVPWVSGLLLQ